MSIPVIRDPALPGLELAADAARLTTAISDALAQATGGVWQCEAATVQRFRYRAGQRAILQVNLDLNARDAQAIKVPGALWIFAGAKSRNPAGTAGAALPGSLFDPWTGGLLTFFPHDRRVQGIADFCADPGAYARALIGGPAASAPELSRYRPGIGATFRWQGTAGAAYVKVTGERPAHETCRELERLTAACTGVLATPEPLGFADPIGAVAIGEARGRPLGDILTAGQSGQTRRALATVLDSFAALNALQIRPRRTRTAEDLLGRARTTAALIAAADPGLGQQVATCVQVLEHDVPQLHAAPVHMDMKIEHVLVDGDRAALLDMDSLALSDPLYDPAMLAARIQTAALLGHVPTATATDACALLGDCAQSPRERTAYRWLGTVARLQTLRFIVQNPQTGWRRKAPHILKQIRDGEPS